MSIGRRVWLRLLATTGRVSHRCRSRPYPRHWLTHRCGGRSISFTGARVTLFDLGFTECQERLYRALLADECLDIGDLGQLIGTGDESTRAELAGLVQLGALEVDPMAAAGVRVVHPMSALRKHVEQAEDELLRRRRAVSDVRTELELLSSVYARRLAGTGEGCERVESVDDVR